MPSDSDATLPPSTPSASLSALIDMKSFERIRAAGELPSPKGPALAIIQLTQRENVSIAELARAVRPDPAFVGRLLKAANSAQRHGRPAIVAIQDALAVLGVPAVRTMALCFSLISGHRGGSCRNFDYQRFWAQSLVRAVAMQTLALRTRLATPDEAFSIGLLADVGRLGLASAFPDRYAEVLSRQQMDVNADLLDLEQEAFGMTHGELSLAMLLDWGFPTTFAEPVFYLGSSLPHEFEAGSRKDMIGGALMLAEHIGAICLATDTGRRAMMSRLFALGDRLAIDAPSLTELCDHVVGAWAEWGEMLSISVRNMPPFEALARLLDQPDSTVETPGEGDAALRMRVLVVDDDRGMRAVLRSTLGAGGHEVFEAENGKQGFEMALDVRPHLMVVDWLMPEMSGVELTVALRQTKIGRGIYVLLLTEVDDEDRLVEAFEGGVDDYMTKPLNTRLLAARLRAGYRMVQLQQEIEHDREEIRKFAAELALTNRRLQEVAMTDALTGFPNRRYAMERIEQEWSACKRTGRSLSCMVIDVDSFKTINDTHGHDVGDVVLKQTAAALKSGLRTQDTVCRIGGDEFLVICPDTDLAAAMLCGERVRRAVENLSVEAGLQRLRGSISVGVATRDDGMANAAALIKTADQGVYLAKQRGRNCVATVQAVPGGT